MFELLTYSKFILSNPNIIPQHSKSLITLQISIGLQQSIKIQQKGYLKMCNFYHILSIIAHNILLVVFNLFFAFTYRDCTHYKCQGFPITLSAWLLVDAFSRILMAVIIIGIFQGSRRLRMKFHLDEEYQTNMFLTLSAIFIVFSMIWLLIGSILFWGKLFSKGICYGAISVYMFIMLALCYFHIFLFCYCSYKEIKKIQAIQDQINQNR